MRLENAGVVVVIPTIGRKSIDEAIASARNQTCKPQEIIVVDDSAKQEVDVKLENGERLFRTGGTKGPARARNVGVANSFSPLIAFLDDDDLWLENHLETLLGKIKTDNLDAVYSSARVGSRIRPRKRVSGEKNPLAEIYGSIAPFSSPYFLPTPGLVVRREVTNHISFNELLFDREDLWFAHKIFEFGFRISQLEEATIVVRQDSLRKTTRSDWEADRKWAERLMTIESGVARRFVLFIALRNALLRRDFSSCIRALKWIHSN